MRMPSIIGEPIRVVEHDGLTIEEWVGNVATKKDTMSVATVTVTQPTSEPWLTLDYDEWLCVTSGSIELHYIGSDDNIATSITVKQGQTAFVAKGERFRPIFAERATYIAVCLPAFRPDRCIREEEGSDVAAKLNLLHQPNAPQEIDKNDYKEYEVLYHMCEKKHWDEAVAEERAYFPPTFEADGMFTHATAVPSRLIITANHFYTHSKGDWMCIQLSRKALLNLGIKTIFEEAKPVGTTDSSSQWKSWVCPHIYGGIPSHVDGIVTKTYPMKRGADGTFISIVGLTDP